MREQHVHGLKAILGGDAYSIDNACLVIGDERLFSKLQNLISDLSDSCCIRVSVPKENCSGYLVPMNFELPVRKIFEGVRFLARVKYVCDSEFTVDYDLTAYRMPIEGKNILPLINFSGKEQFFLIDVANELNRARELYPTWPIDPIHALAVVQEEMGKLAQSVLQGTYGGDCKRESYFQSVQLAAMAIRFGAAYKNGNFYRQYQSEQREDDQSE